MNATTATQEHNCSVSRRQLCLDLEGSAWYRLADGFCGRSPGDARRQSVTIYESGRAMQSTAAVFAVKSDNQRHAQVSRGYPTMGSCGPAPPSS